MADYEAILREWGLSDKEAKVYLALLQLGTTTVNQVAERADLIRTTAYDVLKVLRERGLVASLVRNKILHFEAADPAKLIESLEEKKRKVQEVLDDLRKMRLPAPEGPVVEMFEGKEGIKVIFEDILEKKQELRGISDVSSIFSLLPYASPRFIERRAKEGIFIKALTERTPETMKLMKKNEKQQLRETRFIQGLKDIPMIEYIYGENVAIISTNINIPLGIIVRHSEFAKEQKLLFELLWKNAEK